MARLPVRRASRKSVLHRASSQTRPLRHLPAKNLIFPGVRYVQAQIFRTEHSSPENC